MRFSLILCTINRTLELTEFLKKLNEQTFKNFELLIVDQNNDERILPIIKPYLNLFSIIYLKSAPGLSKARNVALSQAKGDILSLPDDDCFYTQDLLKEVNDFFKNNKCDGLTVKMENSLSNGVVYNNFPLEKKLTMLDAFATASSMIFLRKNVLDKIGTFNESLGLGSGTQFIGGEDYEILIRAIKNNFKILYEPNISVLHPALNVFEECKKSDTFLNYYKKRIFSSGASDYYILIKHFPIQKRLIILLNNFLGIFYYLLIKFDIKASKSHLYRFNGMVSTIMYLKSI